jgi:hypothetical protein
MKILYDKIAIGSKEWKERQKAISESINELHGRYNTAADKQLSEIWSMMHEDPLQDQAVISYIDTKKDIGYLLAMGRKYQNDEIVSMRSRIRSQVNDQLWKQEELQSRERNVIRKESGIRSQTKIINEKIERLGTLTAIKKQHAEEKLELMGKQSKEIEELYQRIRDMKHHIIGPVPDGIGCDDDERLYQRRKHEIKVRSLEMAESGIGYAAYHDPNRKPRPAHLYKNYGPGKFQRGNTHGNPAYTERVVDDHLYTLEHYYKIKNPAENATKKYRVVLPIDHPSHSETFVNGKMDEHEECVDLEDLFHGGKIAIFPITYRTFEKHKKRRPDADQIEDQGGVKRLQNG